MVEDCLCDGIIFSECICFCCFFGCVVCIVWSFDDVNFFLGDIYDVNLVCVCVCVCVCLGDKVGCCVVGEICLRGVYVVFIGWINCNV